MEKFDAEKLLKSSKAKSINSEEFSKFMDENDPLSEFRKEFLFPKIKNIAENIKDCIDGESDCIYFCGNSLGLLSKNSKEAVESALKTWENFEMKKIVNFYSAVDGWFKNYDRNLCWTKLDESMDLNPNKTMAKIVGAKSIEIAIGNTLTQNLNSLLLTFYKPIPTRYKIMIEAKAFPSDRYAVEAQIQFYGYDPKESLIILHPRDGEYCLRTEDILERIEKEGDEIGVILLPGVQYYTGQYFNIPKITEAGHAKNCIVGWDLAHAVGNVPLNLHDWNVDFAVWCTYKYLNSGPGGIGSLFLHEKHAFKKFEGSRLAGWWAVESEKRFKMVDTYIPRPGASGFLQSTVDILSLSSLTGALEIFAKTNMTAIRTKSILLTGYLEALLKNEFPSLKIATPSDPKQRGSQLSLIFPEIQLLTISKNLYSHGIMCDVRHPDCLRIAPVPLYCCFDDIRKFVNVFHGLI